MRCHAVNSNQHRIKQLSGLWRERKRIAVVSIFFGQSTSSQIKTWILINYECLVLGLVLSNSVFFNLNNLNLNNFFWSVCCVYLIYVLCTLLFCFLPIGLAGPHYSFCPHTVLPISLLCSYWLPLFFFISIKFPRQALHS